MNKAIIITGPSGAGKNTIADYLIGKFSFLNYSISATTRLHQSIQQIACYNYIKETFDVLKNDLVIFSFHLKKKKQKSIAEIYPQKTNSTVN